MWGVDVTSYPAIHTWLRHLYWDIPAFGATTNFEHIKKVCVLYSAPLCSVLLCALTHARKALHEIALADQPVRHHAARAAAGYIAERRVGS